MSINPYIQYEYPQIKSIDTDLYLDLSSYDISYEPNIFNYPGYKRLTITGINDYFGEFFYDIEIYVSINDLATLIEINNNYVYSGLEIKPEVDIYINNLHIVPQYNDYIAYTLTYDSLPINVGTYNIRIASSNKLGGFIDKTYLISPLEITGENTVINVENDLVIGNGYQIWPIINSIITNGSIVLLINDYDILNADTFSNVLPGNAAIQIRGKNNCIGTITFNYKILADLSECDIIINNNVAEYTGDIIYCDSITKDNVTVKWFNHKITSNNYTFIYDHTNDYIYPGEKYGKIIPTNNFYINEKEYIYYIKCDINKCDFSKFKNRYWLDDTLNIDDILNASIKLNTYTLLRNVDYSIEYNNNVNAAGFKEIIITGMGYYYGSRIIECNIIDDTTTIICTNDSYKCLYNITHLTRSMIDINGDNGNTIIAVKLGSSITLIDKEIFKNCINLRIADFSKCSAEIPEGAFENCNNLQYISFENSNTHIPHIYKIKFDTNIFNTNIDDILICTLDNDIPNIELPTLQTFNNDNIIFDFKGWYTNNNIIVNNISNILESLFITDDYKFINIKSITLYAQHIQRLDYLCFTSEDAGAKINLKSNNGPAITLETSPTGEEGSWTPYTVGDEIILENVGDRIMFRNSSDEILVMSTSSSECNYFIIRSGKIAAAGNIMFLMDKTGELKDLSGMDSCYHNMFYGCTSLTQAPELPATTLATNCYHNMFYGCTSLTQAPELPATTLATNCYHNMFFGCKSLIQAPDLPAMTLAESCYSWMFEGCTSLTQAPKLPAMALAYLCYYRMFGDCTSLIQAPDLPATELADRCYDHMFFNCTSLSQAPELQAMKLAWSCCYAMFANCKSLTKAPELPATTLVMECYSKMFINCSKLNNISVNFIAWAPEGTTFYWTDGVARTGTFTCPPDLPEEFGLDKIPEGWIIKRKA